MKAKWEMEKHLLKQENNNKWKCLKYRQWKKFISNFIERFEVWMFGGNVVSFMDDKWSSKLTINNNTGWIDEQAAKKNGILLIF